jgi:hypothetical protein
VIRRFRQEPRGWARPGLGNALATALSITAALTALGVAVADIAWLLAGRAALPGVIAVFLILLTALAFNATHQEGSQ